MNGNSEISFMVNLNHIYRNMRMFLRLMLFKNYKSKILILKMNKSIEKLINRLKDFLFQNLPRWIERIYSTLNSVTLQFMYYFFN